MKKYISNEAVYEAMKQCLWFSHDKDMQAMKQCMKQYTSVYGFHIHMQAILSFSYASRTSNEAASMVSHEKTHTPSGNMSIFVHTYDTKHALCFLHGTAHTYLFLFPAHHTRMVHAKQGKRRACLR